MSLLSSNFVQDVQGATNAMHSVMHTMNANKIKASSLLVHVVQDSGVRARVYDVLTRIFLPRLMFILIITIIIYPTRKKNHTHPAHDFKDINFNTLTMCMTCTQPCTFSTNQCQPIINKDMS